MINKPEDYLSTFCEIRGTECINNHRKSDPCNRTCCFWPPVNMDELCLVAEEFCITVVEDKQRLWGAPITIRTEVLA